MKKTPALLVLVLLLFVSCSTAKPESVFYYGFFSDRAVMVAYSASKNTVYDITLPLDSIIQWGFSHGIENVPNAIRTFSGYQDRAFMYGSPDTFNAICSINEVLEDSPSALKNSKLLANINTICNADFSALADIIEKK